MKQVTSRRGILQGLAALPLLTAPAAAAPSAGEGENPDRALFEAEAAYLQAKEAHEVADWLYDAASDVFWAELGPCPESLALTEDERCYTCGPSSWSRGFRIHSRWVFTNLSTETCDKRQAWTVESLTAAIRDVPGALGRAGRTPHYIRRWRSLLPIAEAFDDRWNELRARYRVEELRAARNEASQAKLSAEAKFFRLPAATLAGLALKVRHLDTCGWMGMDRSWIALLQSAAAVTGVVLREPQFDCERWARELLAAGGSIRLNPDTGEIGVHFPVDCKHTSEQRETLSRLSHAQQANQTEIRFWLSQREATWNGFAIGAPATVS